MNCTKMKDSCTSFRLLERNYQKKGLNKMSNYCLICFQEIIPKIGWESLISEEKKQVICQTCKNNFQKIEGSTCKICNRPLDQLDSQFIHDDICNDCIRWEEDPNWQGCLKENHSLFLYNDFLQDVIARFKFRGDYILAAMFAEELLQTLNPQTYDLLIPIPLSQERLYERGFNQADAIIKEAGLPSSNLLQRIHTEKMSKKSRQERIHAQQVFQLTSHQSIEGKRIMLIDDIYTTGTTIRHAAKVLIDSGATSVSSITIARG